MYQYNMKFFKIHSMSTQGAIVLAAVIVGLSIFLTTLVFFGGEANRQKLFTKTPAVQQRTTPPTLSPEQIKKIQEQRAAQTNKQAATSTKTTE